MRTASLLSWLVVVAGIWEVLSPFVVGYSALTVAMWNAIIVGVILILLAGWAAFSQNISTDRTLDWINAILGGWLLVSPFILGYSAARIALWNDAIIGILVIILAGWAATSYGRPAAPQS
jgi:hypothetical protein